MPSSDSDATHDSSEGPSPGVASALSLFVLLHFFVVFVALSANTNPSPLQSRLMRVFAPYTQTFNFDLNFTPYQLTQATDQDVDHRIEYTTASETEREDSEAWQNITRGWRGGDRRKRYQRMASVLSYFREDSATSSHIARSVAGGVAGHDGEPVKGIRCVKHFLLPWDRYGDSRLGDPNSDQYFQTVYNANVLVGESGVVDIAKIDAPSEVARPTVREEDKQ